MRKTLFILFAFVFILSSCEKEEPKTNNDSVLTKANVYGEVKLYDEFGNPVSNERMVVSMLQFDGEASDYWTETEKDGSFLVLNVPYFNNYSVVYSKNGFGSYKRFGFEHQYTGAEGHLEDVNLGEKSSAYCSSLLVTQSNDSTHFQLSLSGGSDAGKRRIRLLFHTIPQISSEVFSHYTPKLIAINSQPLISLSKEYLLNEVGLISGQTYYVQVYGDSYFSNAYFDEYQQKQILPNLGASSEISVPTATFVMP
jgi:hypothetical protein